MASRKVTYGFGRIADIILAILPTNIILGIFKRIQRKNWLGVVLNIVLLPIFYVVDLITIIVDDTLKLLVD